MVAFLAESVSATSSNKNIPNRFVWLRASEMLRSPFTSVSIKSLYQLSILLLWSDEYTPATITMIARGTKAISSLRRSLRFARRPIFDATPVDTKVGSKSPGERRFGRLLIQFDSFSSENGRHDCQNEQASHCLPLTQSFG